MLRYFRSAFLVRPRLPGLGAVPVNLLALLGFGILGLGNPGFWLLGLGMEAAFVTALATHPRFQRWVDGLRLQAQAGRAAVSREALLAALVPARRARYQTLVERCQRILRLYRDTHVEEVVVSTNQAALDKLTWTHLRLLTAEQQLEASERLVAHGEIERQVAALRRELAGSELSPAAREAKSATLGILDKRLENVGRRAEMLAEIQADAERIEAQVDLALENAMMEGRPQVVTTDLGLLSGFIGTSWLEGPEAQFLQLPPSEEKETSPPPPRAARRERS